MNIIYYLYINKCRKVWRLKEIQQQKRDKKKWQTKYLKGAAQTNKRVRDLSVYTERSVFNSLEPKYKPGMAMHTSDPNTMAGRNRITWNCLLPA